MKQIKFHSPYFSGKELIYIKDIFESGSTIAGDGPYTLRSTLWLQKKFNVHKVLLTTSCTAALEMAARLLNLKPGDEVIMPSFTFTSTANAVLLSGLRVRFADISLNTLNIDPDDVVNKLSKRTKALLIMHYAGVSCDMGKILAIAKKYKLSIIEDAAHAIGAKYKNKYLGTMGDFGCISFHETKNITSGEGGALLINAIDKNISERAEIMREKGTDRMRFLRGEIDKYTWVNIGSSYLPSDLLAAVLYAQLQNLDKIQRNRLVIYNYYREKLSVFEKKGIINLPIVPEYALHNAHTFFVRFKSERERNRVLHFLKKNQIDARFHYIPLHLSPMGKKLGYRQGNLPLSEKASSTLLRLPLYAGMKKAEYQHVAEVIAEIIK